MSPTHLVLHAEFIRKKSPLERKLWWAGKLPLETADSWRVLKSNAYNILKLSPHSFPWRKERGIYLQHSQPASLWRPKYSIVSVPDCKCAVEDNLYLHQWALLHASKSSISWTQCFSAWQIPLFGNIFHFPQHMPNLTLPFSTLSK